MNSGCCACNHIVFLNETVLINTTVLGEKIVHSDNINAATHCSLSCNAPQRKTLSEPMSNRDVFTAPRALLCYTACWNAGKARSGQPPDTESICGTCAASVHREIRSSVARAQRSNSNIRRRRSSRGSAAVVLTCCCFLRSVSTCGSARHVTNLTRCFAIRALCKCDAAQLLCGADVRVFILMHKCLRKQGNE